MRLSPGDPAPDFSLPDDEEKPVTLMQVRGQRVVVYFYPAALTPGCTKQACDFRDSLRTLQHAGLAVVGISPDSPAKLQKVRDSEGLPPASRPISAANMPAQLTTRHRRRARRCR